MIRFCEILRTPLNVGKSDVGPVATYIDRQGSFAAPNDDMAHKIDLDPSKATKWADGILAILRGLSVSHAGLDAMVGRRTSSQFAPFSRFDRGMLKPLYGILYVRPFIATLSPIFRRARFWRYATLVSLPPHCWSLGFSPLRPLYGRVLRGGPLVSGLAGIIPRGHRGKCGHLTSSGAPLLPAVGLYTREDSTGDIAQYRDTSVISGLELFTVSATILSPRYTLMGCAVSAYVDSNAARPALIKGRRPHI